jgi:hypothetical protein
MSSPSANGTNGRKSNGQFAKGNPGGPGNPYARRVARLRATLLDAVGEVGIAEIVQKLVSAAKGGDVQAAKLVLSYTLGKPVESIHPDALDMHEQELEVQMRCDPSSVVIDDETRARIDMIVAAADFVKADY